MARVNLKVTDKGFREVFFVSKIIGMFPHTNRNFDITTKGKVVSFLYFVFYLLVSLYPFVACGIRHREYDIVEKWLYYSELFALEGINIFLQAWIISKIGCIKRAKKEIGWLERTLQWYGLQWNWRPHVCDVLGNLLFTTVCLLGSVINHNFEPTSYTVCTLWFFFNYNAVFVIVNQFSCFMSLIRSLTDKVVKLTDSKVTISLLESVFVATDELLEFYGPLIALVISFVYNPILFVFYSLFVNGPKMGLFIWSTYCFWPLLQLMICCYRTQLKVI